MADAIGNLFTKAIATDVQWFFMTHLRLYQTLAWHAVDPLDGDND